MRARAPKVKLGPQVGGRFGEVWASSCGASHAPARRAERAPRLLRLVAAGLSNAEIAEQLVISPLTAKTHVGRVLSKLDCHDRAQLVAIAYQTGFVVPRTREHAATERAVRPSR